MDGDWNLTGCRWDDPRRLKTAREVTALVHEIGFLPLFSVGISGFSVEERVSAYDWWTDEPEKDPWIWRMLIAQEEDIAYGKFFNRKAGFISKKWFPAFANYRRDGYDIEGLYEDGKMNGRAKKTLDVLQLNDDAIGLEMMSGELRKKAAVEKGFDGVLIDLQMQSFLLISKFQRKRNKRGEEYGWNLPSFMTPETKWGYDFVNSVDEEPGKSLDRIVEQLAVHFPKTDEKDIRRVMKR